MAREMRRYCIDVVDDDDHCFDETVDLLKSILDPNKFTVIASRKTTVIGTTPTRIDTNDKALWDFEKGPFPEIVVLDARLKDGLSTKLVEGANRSERRQHLEVPQPIFIIHSAEWNNPEIRGEFVKLGVTKGAMKFDREGLKTAVLDAAKEFEELEAQLYSHYHQP